MTTLEALIDYLVPALVLAAIIGGWRVSTKIDVVSDRMARGFASLHSDIQDLKLQTKSHDDRIRHVEISQARREGKEEAELN